MKLKSWTLVLTIAFATAARAATNDLTGLLQKGLFEEEANRDLTAAIANYQSLASAFDKDRQLAATAIFRLGECYRKLGNTNEAVVQYQRIIKEFGDQPTLVTLSQQNLTGLGVSNSSAGTSVSGASAGTSDVLRQELEEVNAKLMKTRALLETLEAMNRSKLEQALPQLVPDAQLDALEAGLNQAAENLIKLKSEYGADHPKYKSAEEAIDELHGNIKSRIDGILAGLKAQIDAETTYQDHLMQELDQRRDVVTRANEQLAADRAKLQQLLATYLPENSKVVELQRKIDGETATLKELTDKVQNAQAPNTLPNGVPSTDEEQQEIRRIQAMIQNSPDLINAPNGEGMTPLLLAAEKGQLVVAKYLLDHGAEVNGLSRNHGDVPLTIAAGNGHKAMVELLLARGADVNAGGLNPLYFAVLRGFTGVAQVLLANKADVNLVSGTDTSGMRPIHIAARDNKTELVQLLIKNGADVNVSDPSGITPLELAAMMNSTAAAKLLLDAKATVDAKDRTGNTPLHEAARAGNSEVVSLLLSTGTAVDSANNDNATPLLLSVAGGHADATRVLLEHKADPNHRGNIRQWRDPYSGTPDRNWQPVSFAIAAPNEEILKLLLDAGANPEGDSADPKEMSPLFLAMSRNNVNAVQLLLEHRANPNRGRDGGELALTFVLRAQRDKRMIPMLLDKGADPNPTNTWNVPLFNTQDPEIGRWLIEHKADVNIRLPDQRTPLMVAVNTNFLEFLLENGAKADLQDTNGNTALHFAVYNSQPDSIAILLEHKANPNIQNNNGYTPLDLAKEGTGGHIIGTHLYPVSNETRGMVRTVQSKISDLLTAAGGLANLPKRDRIEVRRGSNIAFTISRDSQGRNRTSLLESIAIAYGLLGQTTSGAWVATTDTRQNSFNLNLRFPDFKKAVIYKRTADSAKQTAMNVDVESILNTGDCSRDAWLDWGDVVEIPESDHPVDEQWPGLTDPYTDSLSKCLTRQIFIVIKGERTALKLAPEFTPARRFAGDTMGRLVHTSFMLRSVLDNSKLIRVSSDLSRVKVTRIDPAIKKKTEWIVDCTDNKQSDLWLRDGDVIEVPEK